MTELEASGFNATFRCRWGPMVYNKHDLYVGRSLATYGEYSWLEQELFATLVRADDLVVDAGANIGAHTVNLSRLVGPRGVVLAFEPVRIVFQLLCANLALNHCSNVWAFQDALGDAPKFVGVPNPNPAEPQNFGGLSIGTRDEQVRCMPLDDFGVERCGLIKADVEGMEVEVLRGAARTIAAQRPVLYVENDRGRGPELIGLIMSMGYNLYWHTPPLFNPTNFAGVKEDIFNIASVNMLCLPTERKVGGEGLTRILSPSDTWRP